MKKHFRARTVRHQPGAMNKTEAAYSLVLQVKKAAGDVLEFWFEGLTLKLGPDCRYTPDFVVQRADGSLELHEVKAGIVESDKVKPLWKDDSAVKVRTAADKFPFRFLVVFQAPDAHGGDWREIEVG